LYIRSQTRNHPTKAPSPNTNLKSIELSFEPKDTVQAGDTNFSAAETRFHSMGRRHRSSGERFQSSQAQVQQTQENQSEEITSDFSGRDGYDKDFLGTSLSLPRLDDSIKDQAATLIGKPDQTELEYTNFSIVMNKERRQAFYSAVNIDGAKVVDLPRNGKWTIDGRIPREHQLGNEAYSNNPIDRGHMVRRRDPVWGPEASRANNDTFAYTNAGLQHGDLNQKTWLDLENYVLEQAKAKGQKLTVLTGPVFSDDDPKFNNSGRMKEATQIPKEFWKVVVWNDPQEGLKGAAFLQSQKDYIGHTLFKSDFDPSGMSTYQIPLQDLEAMTKLDFGDLGDTANGTRRLQEGSQARLF
jgi:endonuclease G, mitochondrial